MRIEQKGAFRLRRREVIVTAPLLLATSCTSALQKPFMPFFKEQTNDFHALPFVSVAEAIKDTETRRTRIPKSAERLSPLEKLLNSTALAESPVGLANGHLWDETEEQEIGNLTFPVNPMLATSSDGNKRFVLFTNGPHSVFTRANETFENTHRKVFERTVASMQGGSVGTAVVEIDTDFRPDKLIDPGS